MPREKKLIVPKAGLSVPLPDGSRNLSAAGDELTVTPYWLRRARDGDVTLKPRAKRAPSKPKGDDK